jgi:hypothetical protein
VLSERRDVGGVCIHLVAIEGLRRTAVAAAVMRDHTKTLGQEEHHLRVPVVRAQRPAVMKHQRLTAAPIFVENFGAVFGLDEAHGNSPGGLCKSNMIAECISAMKVRSCALQCSGTSCRGCFQLLSGAHSTDAREGHKLDDR